MIFIIYLFLFLYLIYCYKFYLVLDFNDFKCNYKFYFKKYFCFYILCLFLMVISNFFINMYIGNSYNQVNNIFSLNSNFLFNLFRILFVGVFIEEMFFRFILKRQCFYSCLSFCLHSALLFGLCHCLSSVYIYELLYVIPYGILGYCFAYMYWYSDNIFVSLSFHILHNFIALIFILF